MLLQNAFREGKKMSPTGKNLPEINKFLAVGKITG
jgi:hypothetical protein